jgi:hypothetical protein
MNKRENKDSPSMIERTRTHKVKTSENSFSKTSKLRKQSSYLHPLWMRTDVLKGLIYPNKGPLTQRQHKTLRVLSSLNL